MKLFILSSLLVLSSTNAQPSNDECVDATLIPSSPSFPYINNVTDFVNATENENDTPLTCFSFVVDPTIDNSTLTPSIAPTFIYEKKSIWYTWEPASNGTFDFSTIGSTSEEFPIYLNLGIFEGDTCGTFNEVACGYSFIPAIEVTAGKKYYIQVFGEVYTDLEHIAVLTIQPTPPPPPNDECVDAIVIPPIVTSPYTTAPIDVASATGNASDPVLACTFGSASIFPSTAPLFPSSVPVPIEPASIFPTSAPIDPVTYSQTVWYTWTPIVTGPYDFSTLGSTDVYGTDLYTAIGIYTGDTCDTLEEIACTNYGYGTSKVRNVPIEVGTTYFIQVVTYIGLSGGKVILTVKPTPPPPSNDECINAITVDPFASNAVIVGDTTDAFVDDTINDGTCGVSINAPGIWYKFTNTLQSSVAIAVSTCNETETTYDTQISIFKGTNCNTLQCIGGNDDSDCGVSSKFNFIATGSTTYYILVHGFSGASGNFALTVDGSLNYFALIDSKTDKALTVLDDIVQYESIGSSTPNLNIQAVFGNSTVVTQSVRVTFDNPKRSFCEKKAPYSIFKDNNGNYFDVIIPIGTHEVTATPYTGTNCNGNAGTTMSQTFEMYGCYTTFYVYEITFDTIISTELYDSTQINGCNINIEAFAICGFNITTVQIDLRNNNNTVVQSNTEKAYPYYLFGNTGDTINTGSIDPGTYVIEMTIDGLKHPAVEFDVVDTANSGCN